MTVSEREVEAAKKAILELRGPAFGPPEHLERIAKRWDEAAERFARAALEAAQRVREEQKP